jgi:hypothetical protein
MKPTLTKEIVMSTIRKALLDKKETVKFLKGEISKSQLEEKGIKIATPL